MAKKLEEYDRKRDFQATPEPRSRDPRPATRNLPRFVIQEHSATRLHWDLRLEHDGVLLSWAVPNGIPQDPAENRKAVHTEDHPLEYLDFHGEIPKGNYGAGTMTIWDCGTYEPEKLRDDKAIVVFHGERVKGRYSLFRTGPDDKDWMIHRMDPAADTSREPMPERVVPMLARAGSLPDDEGPYGFEVKWGGMRAVVHSQPGRMRIDGADLADLTAQWPELARLNRALHAHEAVLDGEIVVLDDDGRPSADRLARRAGAAESQARRLAKAIPGSFVAFDLLWLDGHSLMELPYSERRERLEELEIEGEHWRTAPSYSGEGRPLLLATEQQRLPGVVAKRLDSAYEPGQRCQSWIEILHDAEPGGAPFPVRELPKGALEADVDGRKLRLSNFAKVLYPQAGFTKGDMIGYYARIAEVLLPHLRDRPLTLKRYPNGVEGEYFYEKQCPSHRPDWVQTAAVGKINFCLANDRATLVWAANLADIELHTSLSLADPIERPTMMVFDLDPGEPADIVECCRVACRLREIFDPLGLELFAKTSGSKGLQVYVPLNSDVTYDDTKPFAKAVAELLEKQDPDLVVSRMSKELRPGKVLVDWSQNDEHKTTVNVYSLRAKDRPTVSTPLSWEEVESCSHADDLRFEQHEVLERVERDGDLFAPVLTLTQELPRFG